MALFKDARYLQSGTGIPFVSLYPPGSDAPVAGIYRCSGCGNEIVSHRDHNLPPENHHRHAIGQGPIRWHLIVGTNP